MTMGRKWTPEALIANVVLDSNGCWLWQGHVRKATGYGVVSYENREWLAHRWFYQYAKGQIPAGLHIDHLCRVRSCVNPDHLEAVTQAENNRRSAANGGVLWQGRTVCRNGHQATPGERCRECRRKTAREWARRNSKQKGRMTVDVELASEAA